MIIARSANAYKKLKEMIKSLTKHKTEVMSWMKGIEGQSDKVESELAILVGVQSQETTAFVNSQLANFEQLSETQMRDMKETLNTLSEHLKQEIQNKNIYIHKHGCKTTVLWSQNCCGGNSGTCKLPYPNKMDIAKCQIKQLASNQ